MTISSEIYRTYCEAKTIKFIDDKEHFLNECKKRAVSESYNELYGITNYKFIDNSFISYCSENDQVASGIITDSF
jgi:hypothetical protein